VLADCVVPLCKRLQTLSGCRIPYPDESVQGTRYNQGGVSIEMNGCDVVEVGVQSSDASAFGHVPNFDIPFTSPGYQKG